MLSLHEVLWLVMQRWSIVTILLHEELIEYFLQFNYLILDYFFPLAFLHCILNYRALILR
jgi:hypothetical protein